MGSLNEKLLEDHLQSLPDLPFDYVVPADVYSNFKPVPLKRDATDHPRVARTHVRVVRVEAKLRPVVVHRACTTANVTLGACCSWCMPHGTLCAMISEPAPCYLPSHLDSLYICQGLAFNV